MFYSLTSKLALIDVLMMKRKLYCDIGEEFGYFLEFTHVSTTA